MIAYWLLILIPAWGALAAVNRYRWSGPIALAIWLLLTVMIGLRYEVGGDWEIYLENMFRYQGLNIEQVVEMVLRRDPAYEFFSWMSLYLGFGIYGVNVICAGIFSFGLVLFCMAQPRPWLALCLAIPYLVIVVAMGYTRQSVAIGLMMPGFLALARGKLKQFVIWVILAAAFQQTTVLTLAFLLPALPGRTLLVRLTRLLVMSVVTFVLYQTFLSARVDTFIQGYIISQQMQSEGAAIRVAMNALPSVVFLIWGRRLNLPTGEYRLWFGITLLAIACVVGLWVVPSTTVVDRIALYAIPIQLFVGSRLADLRLLSLSAADLIVLTVVLAIMVQFIWLFFAKTAFAWLPYQNILLIN